MVWLWLLAPLTLIAGTAALAVATRRLDAERRRLVAATGELTTLRTARAGAHGRPGAHR
jgi:hypothetical protein